MIQQHTSLSFNSLRATNQIGSFSYIYNVIVGDKDYVILSCDTRLCVFQNRTDVEFTDAVLHLFLSISIVPEVITAYRLCSSTFRSFVCLLGGWSFDYSRSASVVVFEFAKGSGVEQQQHITGNNMHVTLC